MTIAAVQARMAVLDARVNGVPSSSVASPSRDAASFDSMLAAALGTKSPASIRAGADGAAAGGNDVVQAAMRYLGVPYVWGGTDPATGLDCSGLTQQAFRRVGVELPRVAADQARVGAPVASLADARPGDLVFFGSPIDHVGIYAGNGNMIAAPHAGDVVKIQKVYDTPTAIRRVTGDGPLSGSSDYAADFQRATATYGLPQGLLEAVARVESGMRPDAVSPAGAQGLMQLMPATARGLGVDPLQPAQAIDGAARLLSSNLQSFGSVPLALAAYNAGGGAVARFGGIPPYPETQAYVQKVLAQLGGGS